MKKLSNSQLTQTGGAILSFKNISVFTSGFAVGFIARKIYTKTQAQKSNGFVNVMMQEFSEASDFINNEAIPKMQRIYKSAKDAIFN